MKKALRCNVSDAIYREERGVTIWQTFAGRDNDDEYNDCAVVSLSIAADIPYQEAHAICKAAGRKDRSYLLWDEFRLTGPFKWQAVYPDRMPLFRFVKRYTKGRYVVMLRPSGSRCHALNVINGEIFDSAVNSPRCLVSYAWRFLGLRSDVIKRY